MAGPVLTVDCHYVRPGRAAVYLILEEGRATLVDTNTAKALPHLLGALEENRLRPESVEWVVVTHLHLDHAGGTAAVLEACPNATALVHPRAIRHLADPSRLVQSAKAVYGEEIFKQLHGTVTAVPEDRLRAVEDGEKLDFGGRVFTFFHTAGHARHHICLHDSGSNSVFTGDAFGVGYPPLQRGAAPTLFCSTAPTDFEPDEARKTVVRLLATGAERAYLTHFGAMEDLPGAARSLRWSIDAMEAILKEALLTDLDGAALETFCRNRVQQAFDETLNHCGVLRRPADQEWMDADVALNAQGLLYVLQRLRNR